MKRRELLRSSLALPAAAAANALPAAAADDAEAQRRRAVQGMNVVLFVTDQQRAIQHFPRNWARQNLPGATRLADNGLTFTNAFCNACMCSPSRATLMTGFFPAQHGVKYTLEVDMEEPANPQAELPGPDRMPNIGTVMAAAGYATPYKGKWHLSKPADMNTDPAKNPPCTPDEGWAPGDVNGYGFERWNPQDAGANQFICQAGGFDGAVVENDVRFMEADGDAAAGEEGVLAYLRSDAAKQGPFFLVVSLVNPHDVLSYPRAFEDFGYDDSWLEGSGIDLPATVDEDLKSKPTAQRQFLAISSGGLGPLPTNQQKQNYLNFYANLLKEADRHLVRILDTLEDEGMLNDTLVIQTSDHGEMGMAHGGMRQKNFNFYEETLRVPLVYSNPVLYPRPVSTDAMVSHVDFLPTIASLFGAPSSARAKWQGRDYARIVLNPKRAKPVQRYIVFTYDDFQAGQASGPYVPQPNHIVSIRERRYKLARYWDPDGNEPDQWEMYDLKRDPLERRNLAAPDARRTRKQQKRYRRLKKKLAKVERRRLRPTTTAAIEHTVAHG